MSFSLLLSGFPGCTVVKNSPANAGYLSSIRGSGRLPGVENGNPLQYSYLENSMDRRSLVDYGAWDHKESDTHMHARYCYLIHTSLLLRDTHSLVGT